MFAGGNELLFQSFFPAQAPEIRSSQLSSPYLMPSAPMLDFNPPQLSLQQLLLNTLTPSPPALSPQQQLLNQLRFQLLCQQPNFIDMLSQSTGAKLVETTEVPDERLQEKIHEKISPVPQLIPVQVPSKAISRKRASSSISPTHQPKRHKALRKLHNVDTETNSPVSGMWIKDASEVSADDMSKAGDLDDSAAFVEFNEESKRRIAEIPNLIGGSKCFLCKREYLDVFRLAMHRCPRIGHQEYKCPECGKVFNCPANLASHRRWHRPQEARASNCTHCSLAFETKKALREHKCPQKMVSNNLSSRNSIISTASETMSISTLSPDYSEFPSTPASSSNHEQVPIISLGLNSGSLQLHPGFKLEPEE